ncbi:MAG: glycosyltransferase family 2 protein [Halobacteriota archaeon]
MPLVSVLMKNYNYERFIAEAIESVLGQDFEDLELIIVDDASTDASRQIIESYQERDHRVRAIFHECNFGISKVVNDGIEAARGKYIAQIDSDDVWMKDKLTRQLEAVKNDENLVVYSEGELIDKKGESLAKTFSELHESVSRKKSGNIFEELLIRNFIFNSSLMYKRANLGNIRYDENLRYVNDYKFALELAREYEFSYLEEPLAKYRIHDRGAAGRMHVAATKKEFDALVRVLTKEEFIIWEQMMRQYKKEIPNATKALLYRQHSDYAADIGDHRKDISFMLHAAMYDPWNKSNLAYARKTFKRVLPNLKK